jgi:hypothetical protein
MPPLACISEAVCAIRAEPTRWEELACACECALRAAGQSRLDSFVILCADLLRRALATPAAERRMEVMTVLLATQHTLNGDRLQGKRPA